MKFHFWRIPFCNMYIESQISNHKSIITFEKMLYRFLFLNYYFFGNYYHFFFHVIPFLSHYFCHKRLDLSVNYECLKLKNLRLYLYFSLYSSNSFFKSQYFLSFCHQDATFLSHSSLLVLEFSVSIISSST